MSTSSSPTEQQALRNGRRRPRHSATAATTSAPQARTGGHTDRAVGRGRQARLPRRQPARGVRRRRRRHRRTLHRARGARRRRLPAADDGRLAGDLRHRHRPLRHRRAEAARGCPASPTASLTMAFGITEPDAGSNSHRITTTARRDGDDWLLTGRKVFISGVDIADAVADRRPHRGRPHGQAASPACSSSHATPRASRAARSTWNCQRRRSSSSCSSTTSGCPPTRWSATRTPACSSCSPASTRSAS